MQKKHQERYVFNDIESAKAQRFLFSSMPEDLSSNEILILDFIAKKTLLFNKFFEFISNSDLQKHTKLSRRAVFYGLGKLEERGLIVRFQKHTNKKNMYGIVHLLKIPDEKIMDKIKNEIADKSEFIFRSIQGKKQSKNTPRAMKKEDDNHTQIHSKNNPKNDNFAQQQITMNVEILNKTSEFLNSWGCTTCTPRPLGVHHMHPPIYNNNYQEKVISTTLLSRQINFAASEVRGVTFPSTETVGRMIENSMVNFANDTGNKSDTVSLKNPAGEEMKLEDLVNQAVEKNKKAAERRIEKEAKRKKISQSGCILIWERTYRSEFPDDPYQPIPSDSLPILVSKLKSAFRGKEDEAYGFLQWSIENWRGVIAAMHWMRDRPHTPNVRFYVKMFHKFSDYHENQLRMVEDQQQFLAEDPVLSERRRLERRGYSDEAIEAHLVKFRKSRGILTEEEQKEKERFSHINRTAQMLQEFQRNQHAIEYRYKHAKNPDGSVSLPKFVGDEPVKDSKGREYPPEVMIFLTAPPYEEDPEKLLEAWDKAFALAYHIYLSRGGLPYRWETEIPEAGTRTEDLSDLSEDDLADLLDDMEAGR